MEAQTPAVLTFDENKGVILSIFSKSEDGKSGLSESHLQHLFETASNPNSESPNQACLNLCYFIEQCVKSKSTVLGELVFSQSTCLKLFDFYLEWSERYHRKSMKQILDLTATLLSSNPNVEISAEIKAAILKRITTVISHKASQPMVKPAFKALDVLLSKKAVLPLDILKSHHMVVSGDTAIFSDSQDTPKVKDFDGLVSTVFYWMRLFDVSPAAGKFLVTLFFHLRKTSQASDSLQHTSSWRTWIIRGLQGSPDTLENVKNHLFPPLFKLDRDGSVEFLRQLTHEVDFSSNAVRDLDANATLLLAAMEMGKKFGLVEDANTNEDLMGRSKRRDHILLPERAIGNLLSNTSISIRSAALSVLVTSTSATRPFSAETLEFLKQNLGFLHADTDAQFRNNVLSSTRNMLHRLDCAIRYLSDCPRNSAEKKNGNSTTPATSKNADALLEIHLNFKCWYLEFLVKELVPTASYQRHVTALRAIMTLPELNSTFNHSLVTNPHSCLYTTRPTTLSRKMNRLILDLIADPFEDVRACSAQILRSIGMNPEFDRKWKKMVVPGCWIWDDSGPVKPPLKVFQQQRDGTEFVLDLDLISEFISKTEKASLRTGRADLADGVARARELLYSLAPSAKIWAGQECLQGMVSNLERSIQMAQNSLADAVRLSPVHGEFASLCLIVDRISPDFLSLADTTKQGDLVVKGRWNGICQRLISSCQNIWKIVEDVLCNDSPEGHLPEGPLLHTFEKVDTKELLSYSFRAIHESSNLMRALVTKMNLRFADDSSFMEQKQFEEIGDLTFKQLASLRHRGAFSTVSLTFAKCCQQTQSLILPSAEKNRLLQIWYEGSLDCIYEQVSTTRRSAGIPALVTGILSAHAESPSFDSIMAELENLARRPVQLSETDETNLPQVHAMNCMKEIYRSSVLSKKSERCIASGLQLAAENLQSNIWAIRNCGLLLLRSLIDRMFGVYESKTVTEAGWDGLSIKLSYDKYDALPDLLIKLLDVETDSSESDEKNDRAIQTVFPALDIIRRAGPPENYRDQINNLVSRHLGSRVWHVRDIAARTMCTFIRDDIDSAMELLDSYGGSANRCHGVLLTLKYVLQRYGALKLVGDSAEASLYAILCITELLGSPIIRGCADVQATYIEVVNSILRSLLDVPKEAPLGLLSSSVIRLLGESAKLARETLASYEEEAGAPNIRGSSSLLRNAYGLQCVLATALNQDISKLKNFIEAAVDRDPDAACHMLEAIPSVWSALYTDAEILKGHADIYMSILQKPAPSQAQSIASLNLAAVLDRLTEIGDFSSLTSTSLFPAITKNQGSPDLSNAQIRLSGSLLIRQFKPLINSTDSEDRAKLENQLIAWGEMLSAASNANNDFDTRHSAISTLQSFYTFLPETSINSHPTLLPSLLSLYSFLLDDDDEIRDLASLTISSINIQQSHTIPLCTQISFRDYIFQFFSNQEFLRRDLVVKLTGACGKGVRGELAEALKGLGDSTLFIEEEQNLFRDEVREVGVWVGGLRFLGDGEGCEEMVKGLEKWVVEGLGGIREVVVERGWDGPGGWAGNKRVFEICMRVVVVGNALLGYYRREGGGCGESGGEAIRVGMEALWNMGTKQAFHESLMSEIQRGVRVEFCNLLAA